MKIKRIYEIEVAIDYDEKEMTEEQADAVTMATIMCGEAEEEPLKFKITYVSTY